jgi:hypothetical protein
MNCGIGPKQQGLDNCFKRIYCAMHHERLRTEAGGASAKNGVRRPDADPRGGAERAKTGPASLPGSGGKRLAENSDGLGTAPAIARQCLRAAGTPVDSARNIAQID